MTHNSPDLREISHSSPLDSLQQQTLSETNWELLLIDNASSDRLGDVWDPTWHPNGRQLGEDELGLTPARLRGIRKPAGIY